MALTLRNPLADNVPMGQQHYIRRWREAKGLSQEALADAVGRERSYVSRIENGARKYDQPFLEAAAGVLGCTVVDLLARDPSDPEGLWSVYEELTSSQRIQLVEIGRTIIRTALDATRAAQAGLVAGAGADGKTH